MPTESETKNVLISGVSQGIGQATAELFSGEGWHVVGLDLQKPLHDAVDEFWQCDVSDTDTISERVAALQLRLGSLDALVNNAAYQVCKPFAELSLEDWDRTMSVNLRGAFWLMHECAPLLAAKCGSIVNVSSVHAHATSTSICAYATSKGALVALSRSAALDLAPMGIRVNAVLPGAVDTPMLRAGFEREHLAEQDEEDRFETFQKRHPFARVARPAEIARAILYWADASLSPYVTGQSLVVDGGVTARLSTE
jgi:NAD(P)-dependent dehydrogenase (short-subunit alcohol dehydrogenase family)